MKLMEVNRKKDFRKNMTNQREREGERQSETMID